MMSKKEYTSYEEVHAKLVEAMQEACTQDESGQYQSPDIDMSFLYEETGDERKSKNKMSRFSKIAAVIIIVLLGMNFVMLATDSGYVYSDRGLLHRLYEGARGIFTDKDPVEYVESDEVSEECTIYDMDDIEEAKRIWPDLYIPNYIPESYEFCKLIVYKYISGEYAAEYDYISNDLKLEINMTYFEDAEKSLSSNIGDWNEFSDRKVNIYLDERFNVPVADVYMNDYIFYIYGELDENELMKIARNIN